MHVYMCAKQRKKISEIAYQIAIIYNWSSCYACLNVELLVAMLANC